MPAFAVWAAGLIGLLAQSPATFVIREVGHLPAQPKPGEVVTVVARVATNAIQGVTLKLQRVEPGRYIRKADPEYERGWQDFPMRDDGQEGDARANDNLFTCVVPADWQVHRHLVRYRIMLLMAGGASARAPLASDPCPNYAWIALGEPAAWSGASRPGNSPVQVFSPKFLATLPTYHLLARADEVEKSQWHGGFNRVPFSGTLVYDGRVYDHIQFHNRGQASTYVAGKNKWGFKFNPGQPFAAKDLWGRPYKFGWDGFNLNACASPWAQVNRGMAGMDEAVSYRAYQLAGVPSPDVVWVHFRVIDAALEVAERTQYDGDLWGLYLVVQEKNGNWLRENNLPDGNIFSAESGVKHLAKGMPTNGMDLARFQAESRRPSSTEAWWRSHLDLPAYYSFHALNRALANIDLRADGNHCLYHRPDERWVVLPHDLDMMFIPKTHWPGVVEQNRCLDLPALRREYQNRAREILDLFCSDASTNGAQAGQLVAEMAGVLRPAGHTRNWAELDEAMWNWHPRNRARGHFNITPYPDSRMGGEWTRTLATPDLAGFCKYLVEFCTDSRPARNYRVNDGNQRGYGFGHLWIEARDPEIPTRPTLRATNVLVFEASSFASPGGAGFSAVEWRVAEIAAPGLAGFEAGQPWKYELEKAWSSGALTSPATTLRLPAEVCKAERTYRARVRYRDAAGRWSHWSLPVQFVAQAVRQ